MGASKLHLYPPETLTLASIAQVLGHPARIAILRYLNRTKRCSTNDLVTEVGLSQSVISRHLTELKNLGIVKENYRGREMFCYVDHERIGQIRAQILDLLDTFVGSNIS